MFKYIHVSTPSIILSFIRLIWYTQNEKSDNMARRKKKKNNFKFVFLIIIGCILLFVFYNPFLRIQLNGDDKITISVNGEFEDEGVEAYFLGASVEDVQVSSNVNTEKVGNYEVTYQVKKLLTKKEVKRNVEVIETNDQAEITITEEISNVCPNNINVNNYKATDKIDGDITSNVKVTKNGEYLVYSVINSRNIKTIKKVKTTFSDEENPVITLKGNKTTYIKNGSTYNDAGVNVVDNCDGDITSKVNVNNNVKSTTNGTYTVKYEVKDSSGNKSTMERTVVVSNDDVSSYPLVNGYGEDIEGPTYIKGILIVNKIYSIPSTFGGTNSDAQAALKALQVDATNNGYNMGLISGYRSYSTQKTIYERNVKNKGYDGSDFASARPGHSEHQTGLAFDVGKLEYAFGDTEAGKWLEKNCYRFGFIIRYPRGKTDITGYNYEPWHIRYVGLEVAKEIYEQNTTLEEYLGVKGTY